jgi:AraC family transcriptional regulator, transcriptional activator of pobA
MSASDDILIDEFRKAIRRNTSEKVLDLDSNFHQPFDLHVFRFEDVFRGRTRANPPNRWSYVRIGFVKKGTGEFTTGLHNFQATDKTLVIVPARVITSSKDWSEDMEGYIVLFNLEFFLQKNFPRQHIDNKKILLPSVRPYVRLSTEDAADMTALFETILELYKEKDTLSNELLPLKVLELLINCERLFDEQIKLAEDLPQTELIRKYSALVEENFMQERGISFYAKQLNVHPNYLNALIKTGTGKTAKELLQNRLLLEIKYLLHSTNFSVKEIAVQLGFRDPNYFTSFFTRLENMSPSKYRASII